eukprot:GHVN01105775.1.p1 GENE.GHVN01105775.1~~GHVN01105775.1.p1  ORF type:complete len:181 (-),score=36.54 GHVN01105775.1:8-550(-)
MVTRLADKYQTTEDQAQGMIERMVSLGRQCGVDMKFDIAKSGNSFNAHRLQAWATAGCPSEFDKSDSLSSELPSSVEKGEVADRLNEAIFIGYLCQGKALGDDNDLLSIVETVDGIDKTVAERVLKDSDAYSNTVRQDESMAKAMGVSGVPFFVFSKRINISGAQDTHVFSKALQAAWDA